MASNFLRTRDNSKLRKTGRSGLLRAISACGYISVIVPPFFFDGAAKGNLGIAGAGGVIRNADGYIENRYAWGLGHSTNMQVEAMASLQGLKHLQDLGIEKAIFLVTPNPSFEF